MTFFTDLGMRERKEWGRELERDIVCVSDNLETTLQEMCTGMFIHAELLDPAVEP
jgi:hypothetical protein